MNDNRFHIGQRLAGFRILVSDIVVAFCVAVATLLLWYWAQGDEIYQTLALMPLVVLGHFFLFCNVFRISRSLEIIWGIVFALVFYGMPDWYTTGHHFVGPWNFWYQCLLFISPVTIVLIVVVIFSKDYHGIGYHRVPWGRKIQKFDEKENGQK